MPESKTQSKTEPASTVVVGSGKKRLTAGIKRNRTVSLAVAILLILLIGASIGTHFYKKATTKTAKPETFNQVTVATPQNFQSVAAKLQTQANQAGTNDSKAKVYDEIAFNAQNAGQTAAAMQAAQQAYNLAPSAERAAVIGGLYELGKDWGNAVIWYQKAVDASQPTKPGVESPYNDYLGSLNASKNHT